MMCYACLMKAMRAHATWLGWKQKRGDACYMKNLPTHLKAFVEHETFPIKNFLYRAYPLSKSTMLYPSSHPTQIPLHTHEKTQSIHTNFLHDGENCWFDFLFAESFYALVRQICSGEGRNLWRKRKGKKVPNKYCIWAFSQHPHECVVDHNSLGYPPWVHEFHKAISW